VKLEYDFVPFSGSSSFLFNDDRGGGYVGVFGDGQKLWEQMPDDEFKLRAAIYWVAQEISGYLKRTRQDERDADSRAAIERKWTLIYAFSVVVQYVYPGEEWKNQLRKLYRGDWRIDSDDPKGRLVRGIYNAGKSGVIMAYKNAKKIDKEEFVHRNWMRGKNTPSDIKSVLETTILPNLQIKFGPVPN